jgi:hypothetical protein
MDPRSVIANRIDLQLRHHLGQGVDASRVLSDARYARDMLLVCDAMEGTGLPLLARQFRNAEKLLARVGERVKAGQPLAAEQQAMGRDAGPPQPWGANTSGFGLTRPPPPADDAKNSDAAKRPWFSPSRWLGD